MIAQKWGGNFLILHKKTKVFPLLTLYSSGDKIYSRLLPKKDLLSANNPGILHKAAFGTTDEEGQHGECSGKPRGPAAVRAGTPE